MILSNDQADRFYNLFDALMQFSSAYLSEHDRDFVQTLQQGLLNDGQKNLKLIERTWREPQILQKFAAQQHEGIPAQDAAQVATWQDGIFDQYVVVQKPGHIAYFLFEDFIFEVSGISDQLSDLLAHDITAVQTVLVPFDDRIVFGAMLAEQPMQVPLELREILEAELKRNVFEGRLVRTPQEFAQAIPVAREHRANRRG